MKSRSYVMRVKRWPCCRSWVRCWRTCKCHWGFAGIPALALRHSFLMFSKEEDHKGLIFGSKFSEFKYPGYKRVVVCHPLLLHCMKCQLWDCHHFSTVVGVSAGVSAVFTAGGTCRLLAGIGCLFEDPSKYVIAEDRIINRMKDWSAHYCSPSTFNK